MARRWLLVIMVWIVFSVTTVQAQRLRSDFGDKLPTVRECLEFSEETGYWTTGKSVYRFNKDSTFLFKWTNRRTTTNRFGRKTVTSEEVVRKGRWSTEYRAPTASERNKFKIPASADVLMNFLTLQFVGNIEKSIYEQKNNLDPNGTLLFALYEHRNSIDRRKGSLSSLTKLVWFGVDTFYSSFWPKLANEGSLAYKIMEHY